MEKISRNPVIGIVAEYNPFHNGHALHISRAREFLRNQGTEDAPVVVVLSSSFTQRGLPTLADKWTRTHMALANGVDLVLELPFAFACNAASEFARGAVDTLTALGFVTHLSFGMEELGMEELGIKELGARVLELSPRTTASRSPCLASAIANILIHESCAFKRDLKKKLAQGKSYPRSLAETLDGIIPGSGAFVSMPNNVLAISYLLRILEKSSGLEVLPVQREGAGHHDETDRTLIEGPLVEGPPIGGILPSAAAIRSALIHDLQGISWDESWLRRAMPAPVLALLKRELQRGRLWMRTEKLWTLLQGFLERASPEELRRCAGMTEGMENLFLKRYREAASYEDFIGRCVCRRYTRNRLQRQVARCLAGVDGWTALALSRTGPPYIRVLGYNRRGRALLHLRDQIRRAANAPVITRLAAAANPEARALAALEFRASRLRELLLPHPDLKYEEKQKPVFL